MFLTFSKMYSKQDVMERTNKPAFIKLFDLKSSSSQRYNIAQNYRKLNRVVHRLPQHNLKISNHSHI
jgi:hypothetical protein